MLPGLIAIMALSWTVLLGKVTIAQGLFFGLKAAVLVIVVEAVLRVASARSTTTRCGDGGRGLIALFFYDAVSDHHPVAGLIVTRRAPACRRSWSAMASRATSSWPTPIFAAKKRRSTPAQLRVASIAAVFLVLWLVPVAAPASVWAAATFTKIAIFFSQMAGHFGGAYVLAYVAQQAVITITG